MVTVLFEYFNLALHTLIYGFYSDFSMLLQRFDYIFQLQTNVHFTSLSGLPDRETNSLSTATALLGAF